MPHFLTFLAVSAIVIVTPGPDTALTIRNALLGGRRSGFLTAVGVAAGQATWAICTAVGLAALLRASQFAFTAIRIAGIGYLLYLGLYALVSAVRGRYGESSKDARRRSIVPAAGFRQGLLSNLSNPKMVVFFISLLPQFTTSRSATTSLALGFVFCVMTLAWLSAYAVAVAKAGDVLRRPAIRRTLDALAGMTLVALGIRLAIARDQ